MSIGVPGLPIGLRKHSGVNLAALLWPTGTEAGMWLDPSDASTAFQDSAGTTPGAVESPVGKRVSKAGNLSAVLQATATARPVWKLASGIYSDLFDGADDGYATAAFAAGTLTNNMDCFVAINRAVADGGSWLFFDGAKYIAAWDGTAGSTDSGAGTPSYLVDGVSIGASTRLNLQTALGSAVWKVLEIRNLDLSAWVQFVSGNAGGGFNFSGNIGGLILCPAQSDATRSIVRRELGRKVGLSL